VSDILTQTRAEDIFFEQISYAAGLAFQERTGRAIPYPTSSESHPIRGNPWRDDAELRNRYPDLVAKYWE
jgi:hypothetical protein